MQSDHDPILTTIDFTNFTKGKSFWRHNNALIKDPEYVMRIKNHFRLTLAKYVVIENFENFYQDATEAELQTFLNQPNEYYFDQNYSVDPHVLFELILNDARCESISYAAEKKKRRN